MAAKNDPKQLPDIAFGLNQLGKETTAAELVRSQGQSTKLKVISEKKLMSWIESILNRHRAGQADAMSDEEKQELLAKAQMEIQRRLKLEGELAKEKERRAAEVELAQAKLASSTKSTADYEAAIAAYKLQLEQRDKTIEDLQQDTFELQDELNQKVALLSSTMQEKEAEKEKLQHGLRSQMMRSSDLLGGVIGLDNDYYGSHHQANMPASDSATAEEQFYHDFDVGSAIIATLAADLGRVRGIAQSTGSTDGSLLESDLALLAQLKAGSLGAMDVASPVASLVEAITAARAQAQALEIATNEATGLPAPTAALSQVPDAEGDPATVIAGTTQVVRELESLLARERSRLGALKSMVDEADAARNAGENELDAMRAAYDDLVDQVASQAIAADMAVPESLTDVNIAPGERAEIARAMLDQIGAHAANRENPEVKALQTSVASRVRDLGQAVADTKKSRGEPHGELTTRIVDLDRLIARLDQDHAAVDSSDLLRTTHTALDTVQAELHERDRLLAEQAATLAEFERNRSEAGQRVERVQDALSAAQQSQVVLGTQVRDLGQAVFPDDNTDGVEVTGSYGIGQTRVRSLAKALAGAEPAAIAEATRGVLDALRKDSGKYRDKALKIQVDNKRLGHENQSLYDRVDALTKQLNDASARADELLRSERELSQLLISAAQGDDALADTAADLAVTIDDTDATVSDLNAHSKQAVAQLIKRKQQLAGELAKLSTSQADLQTRTFARAKGLESEIQRLTAEVAEKDQELVRIHADMAEVQTQAESERNDAVETAASAKEVIQQLRSQMETRDSELTSLRQSTEANRNELASLREGAAHAETSTKLLGDTLSGLTRLAQEDEHLAPAREALEHALEEMPGEAGIALSDTAAERIAKAAQGLIGTMSLRRAELTEAETEHEREQQGLVARQQTLTAEVAQARQRISELAADLQSQAADAVETAATAKEMIHALQSQVSGRDEKLRDLRSAEERLSQELNANRAHLAQVDAANRRLAETLSDLARAELATAPDLGQLEGVEESRVDLELALSELPAEGETGVVVSADLGQRLAEAGHKTAAALAARRIAITADLTTAQKQAVSLAKRTQILDEELTVARKAASDRESALKRSQVELESMRTDFKAQATQLSLTAQQLTAVRSQFASSQAELEDLRTQVEAQDKQIAVQRQLAAQVAQLRDELDETKTVAASSQQAQEKLSEAVGELTRWDDSEVAALVAPPGSNLAKATGRFTARDARSPENAASAGTEVLRGVKSQLTTLATELAQARSEQQGLGDKNEHLQAELSRSQSTAISRQQELQQNHEEIAALGRRATAAEVAAAELARAVASLDDSGAAAALADHADDPEQLTDPDAVQNVVAAVRAVANRTQELGSERRRLSQELVDLSADQTRLQQELERVRAEARERTREADEARNAERAVATTASELGRDLLIAAKAAAADVDPDSAQEAGRLLDGYDRLSAERRVAAAAGFMPTLREIVTNLAIAQAETQAEVTTARERHIAEMADLRSELDRAAAERNRLEKSATALTAERERLAHELATAMHAITSAQGVASGLEEQLLHSQAELDEWHARGSASSGSAAEASAELREQLAAARARLDASENDLTDLREKLHTTEARMTKSREELASRLAERDQLIIDKTRELEDLASQQADSASLQARISSLTKDLSEAHEQLKQYRQVHGDLSGATAQAGDLRKTLKQAEAEREQLRNHLRELESELADRKGEVEEAQVSAAAKQKELAKVRTKKDQEIEEERASLSKAREAERQLKEENVGLKARLRRLTEK